MHERGLCHHAVSVCVYHVCNSVETSNRIVRLFSLSCRPIILVFPYQTGWQYCDGDPLTRASNARGYEKITIFDQYLTFKVTILFNVK